VIRPLFTEIALFLAPFALYALFLAATRKGLLDPAHWPLTRIASLAIAALLLMIGSFLVLSHFGFRPGCVYIPAHVDKDGKFVPGHCEPVSKQ
jgi:hypothetical protein